MGKGVGQLGSGLARIGTIAATGFAVGIGAAVKVAGDFEAQLNTINTIAKLNDGDLRTLGEGIRQTFRQTGAPLDELTAAYYDLLSAGIKVGDAQAVLNTSVKLGIGGLATTKESVDLLTTAINAYGLNASGAANASDIFAAAVRDGKIVIAELSASFADVAPLAAQTGVKLEEIGAAYATLTARGVQASEVGTQVNRALIELLKPGPDLVKVLKGLGIESFETSIRQKGLVQTLQDVRDEAARLGIPFQDLFGRLEAYKFALATTGPNNAKFIEELGKMGQAAGETDAQFSQRQRGLNYQLGVFKAGIQDAGITIGQALIPKLVPLIEKLNEFLGANQGKIAAFGQKLADGFASFADRIQGIDFSGVLSGLKLLNDIGGKVVDTFLRLPPNIQGLLVTGFAVNKLSGGLLAKGALNIGGGLIKILFERGSSAANPLWVQSALGGVGGPGGGPPIPPGFFPKGLTGWLGFLGIAAADFVLITTAVDVFNEQKRNVEAAKNFQQAVVDERSRTGTTPTQNIAEQQRLAADLQRERQAGGGAEGDPLRFLKDVLKAGFVDPNLDAQLTRLNQEIFAQTTHIQRGDDAVRAELITIGIEDVATNRLIAQSLEQHRAANAKSANVLDTLRSQNTSLQQIAAKPSSFTANVTNIINARLSVTQALATQTVVNSIRRDYRPGDSTGGSL